MADFGTDAADTSGQQELARVNSDIAKEQWAIAKEQIPYFLQRQQELDALTSRVTNTQLGIQQQTADQAKDYYDFAKETYRPVESSLVAQVMTESTPEEYAKLASQAAARTGTQFRLAQSESERAARSMGVDPSSGRARGIDRAATMQAAASRSGAFNAAYDSARNVSYARKLDVAGLGRGLTGASTGAYGIATGAGSAAAGAANQASGTAAATMGTATQWGSAANQSSNTALGAYNAVTNAEQQANNNRAELVGSAMGAAAAMKW